MYIFHLTRSQLVCPNHLFLSPLSDLVIKTPNPGIRHPGSLVANHALMLLAE